MTGKLVFSETIYAQSLSRADIQAAVDAANPGDKVELPSGTNSSFSGTVTINTEGIHLYGQGPANTILKLVSNQEGKYNPLIYISADNVWDSASGSIADEYAAIVGTRRLF